MEKFDELLADDEMKREYEKRLEEARREWERVASLSAEEKLRERAQALDERESALKKGEIRAGARELFIKRGLPPEFAGVFTFEDGKIESGVDLVEAAFRSAVQSEVLSRLGGSVPKAAADIRPESEMSDEEYYSSLNRSF